EGLDARRAGRGELALAGLREWLTGTVDLARRPFEVGAVVPGRADRDAVVADLGEDLELMGDVATHRAGVRLDADRGEPQPLERPHVRAVLRGVRLLEPGLIDVEGVRV